jgi:hypothetical protein
MVHENYMCNNFFETFEQITNNQWIVRQIQKIDLIWFRFLVFNATFSNISAISWRPVLVVEEAGVPWENLDHGQATGKLYHLRLRVECTLFSSPACELLSPLSVHTSVNFSHFNQLIWSHWPNLNQTLVEWSLDGPLPKLCLVILTSNQDGCQTKNRKKGGWNFNCPLLL